MVLGRRPDQVFSFSTAITGNITLYAKWTIDNYTVTFDSNGGSAVASQNVDYNGIASQPTAPARTGYTFAGWYSDAGLASAFSFATAITTDITLYAKWTINSYTVTFDSNGGSAVTSQSVAYNGTATLPAAPTRTGFAFAGWYSDVGLSSAFTFTTAITGDITLHAKWVTPFAITSKPVITAANQAAYSIGGTCSDDGAHGVRADRFGRCHRHLRHARLGAVRHDSGERDGAGAGCR